MLKLFRAATLDNLRQVESYVTKHIIQPMHSMEPVNFNKINFKNTIYQLKLGPPNYGMPPSNMPMHQQMTPQPMQWSNQGWVDDKAQLPQQPNQHASQQLYMSQRSQPYGMAPQTKGQVQQSQNMHYRPDSQQPPYQNSQFSPMYAPVSLQNQTMSMQTNTYASVHRPQSQPPQMMHTAPPQNPMMMPPSSQPIYGNELMSSDAMHTSFDDMYMPMSDLGPGSSDVNMRTSSVTNELPNSIPGDGINSMMQQQSMSGISPNAIGEQAYSEIINVEDRFQFSLASDPSVPNGPLLKCKLSMF